MKKRRLTQLFRACFEAGALMVGLLLCASCAGEAPSAQVSVSRSAIGETEDGFPNWKERVVLVMTNRARCDPVADLASCTVCAERDCYAPVQPVVWNHNLARAARFHSDNLNIGGCRIQHASPCDLVADLATIYTPGSCDGDPACACEPGTFSCGSSATAWSARVGMFGTGPSGENIASGWGGDPVDIFYLWLHEPDTVSDCGFRMDNGHRYNILNGGNRALGVGQSGSIYTQDFSGGGTPDGLVSGVHYPETGGTLEFYANWYRTSDPTAARVNIDGTCHPLTLERGTRENGTYHASLSPGAGCHEYYFHFTDGSDEVYYPTTGSYGIGCTFDWQPARPVPCEGCTPTCGTRVCGDDGCGGICGTCRSDQRCTAGGACVCRSGRTECSGTCIDTDTDPDNCGDCGIVCDPGDSCEAGVCVCPIDCDGAECGDDGCGGACGVCTGGMDCTPERLCACPSGMDDCSGTCADLTSDRDNCGVCGTVCAMGEGCVAGVCIEDCDPDCTDRDCGDDGCGGSCGECTDGLECNRDGLCDCAADSIDCGDGCVDPATDIDHCGACDHACGSGEACVDGVCACQPSCGDRECGDDGCGGSCGDCTDDRLCGDGGRCLCSAALVECGGECVEVRTDAAHCGECDNACAPEEVCVAGECGAGEPDAGCVPACEGRQCGDDGCGESCGECGEDQLCASGGQCLCSDGAAGCADECVDLRSDSSHCGACDNACLPGQRCLDGACVGDADPDDPPSGMSGQMRCDCAVADARPRGSALLALFIFVLGVLIVGRRRTR